MHIFSIIHTSAVLPRTAELLLTISKPVTNKWWLSGVSDVTAPKLLSFISVELVYSPNSKSVSLYLMNKHLTQMRELIQTKHYYCTACQLSTLHVFITPGRLRGSFIETVSEDNSIFFLYNLDLLIVSNLGGETCIRSCVRSKNNTTSVCRLLPW